MHFIMWLNYKLSNVLGQSGRYLCHVDNGIGQALHQIVNLTVKGK